MPADRRQEGKRAPAGPSAASEYSHTMPAARRSPQRQRSPRFRTRAFDEIRRKDDTVESSFLPMVPTANFAQLSPVPTHRSTSPPTNRSTSSSAVRLVGGPAAKSKSPAVQSKSILQDRSYSGVPRQNSKPLSPFSTNVAEAHRSVQRERPATADPTLHISSPSMQSKSILHDRYFSGVPHHSLKALTPVSSNVTEAHRSVQRERPATADPMRRERRIATTGSPDIGAPGSSAHSRRRVPPAMDLDSSFQSMTSMVTGPLNSTMLPFSPRDDAAESVADVINMLERGHAPKALNLRGSLDACEMHEIERLFEHIAAAKGIQALNMNRNHFTEPKSWSLERLLEKNRSCVALRLGNNRMTDKMCAGVFASLHKNNFSRVAEMYIGNNQAGHLTAEAITRALRPGQGGLQNLRILNMSHNRLGDAGGALVVEALQNNVSLRVLDLGSNDLGLKTKSALCKALKFNRGLCELRIERNPGLEDKVGLIDILTVLRFNMHSELTTLHTVEPLSNFCSDADVSGRVTKYWDNRTVIRFLRDVRLWYGDVSTSLFPTTAQMWAGMHKCIKRVQRDLMSRVLLGWHRRCYVCAASQVRRQRHQKQVLKRPYFNLWVNKLTQKFEEPRFLERCAVRESKTLLLYLTIWRLTRRHKSLFTTGTNWLWRIALPEDAIMICQRFMGKEGFVQWYGSWSQYHFLWHVFSVKNRGKNFRLLKLIFTAWSTCTKKIQRRVRALTGKCNIATITPKWKKWRLCVVEGSRRTTVQAEVVRRLKGMRCAVAFSKWRQNAEGTMISRRKIKKVVHLLGHGLLKFVLSAWQKILQKARRMKRMLLKSGNHALKLLVKCTALCVKKWRSIRDWKKKQRQKVKIGLLRFVYKYFVGWKHNMAQRQDEELKQSVIIYRYALSRCKRLLREMSRYVCKAKLLKKGLEILTYDYSTQTKTTFLSWWRRETKGTRLYKRIYLRRLQRKAAECWLWRVDFERQIRRTAKKVKKTFQRRELLKMYTDWASTAKELKVTKKKVGRLLQKLGQRQEKDFFIAWNEGKKKQISLKARIRTARFELHLKYFHWYYKAASVARRQRKAANILLNFGEDRYYTNTMKNWQKIMLTNMRERVLGAVHRSKNMNATRLACLEHRRKCKHIARNFLEWRLSTSVPRSWLRGYEACKGLLKRPELEAFCAKSPHVNVSRLVEVMRLEQAGKTGLLLKEILLHWHKLQSEGDLDYRLELQRFLTFLCQNWTSGEIPESLSFGDIALVSKGGEVSVHRGNDGEICLTIPTVDTTAELRCRIQRALATSLPPSFGSMLTLPCPLLQAAKEFCRDFLRVPSGFLDCRGDHERFTENRVRHVGEPARNYVCPLGWARVGTRVDETIATEHDIWRKWNVSFHAVKQEMVSQIIHSRMLLRPGDVGALGRTIHTIPGILGYLGEATQKTKFVTVPQSDGPDTIEEYNNQDKAHRAEEGAEEFFPCKQFFSTPSVIFASQLSLSSPVSWRGRKAQVILQTRQRPDVTRVLAFNDPTQISLIDHNYSNKELRWFTASYGPAAITITGILFRFVD